MNSFRRIAGCRICGNTELSPVVDLGDQFLTGVFPQSVDEPITRGPLQLVRCSGGRAACGLVQLQHSFDSREMYGDRYGYRSSLNRSMVAHLGSKVRQLSARVTLAPGDVVLDIGSNDGTSLSFYPQSLVRIGIDPAAAKFCRHYAPGITCISDFFSADLFTNASDGRKAKIITSIAMFYDLDRPQDFVEDVARVLDDDGIWHFEQSYMPLMLEKTGYDTICHEHVEYYALEQIEWMMTRAGLRIIDVELNDINGGSFGVTVCKNASPLVSDDAAIDAVRAYEANARLTTAEPYAEFAGRIEKHRIDLVSLLDRIHGSGKTVIGYGASTKGNVMLQFCGIGPDRLPCIAEVNADKFGCVTPGTGIPIVPEADAHALKPDYMLVMPWHFRANLIEREAPFLDRGGRMIFPLPQIEIVEGAKS